MSALVAEESAVQPGYHLPELVIRNAVRTPNDRHCLRDIRRAHLFEAPPLLILPVDDYRNVKIGQWVVSEMCVESFRHPTRIHGRFCQR